MRLAVCSSKGGVGKTSTAADLAGVPGTRGRTLAVDADPQDSLGRAFGVVAKGREDSLAGLLEDPSARLIGVACSQAPGRPTPAFDVTVTPLRWALPSIGPVPAGVGLALRVGPLQVSAALR